MERQVSEDEICSTAIFCGVGESFRRVMVPRTPSLCCSGSTRTFKSYFVNVNASRSSEKAFTTEAQRAQRKQKLRPHNFISHSRTLLCFARGFARVSAAQFHTSRPLPRPTRSTKELCPASESKPESRTSRSEERRVGKEGRARRSPE